MLWHIKVVQKSSIIYERACRCSKVKASLNDRVASKIWGTFQGRFMKLSDLLLINDKFWLASLNISYGKKSKEKTYTRLTSPSVYVLVGNKLVY